MIDWVFWTAGSRMVRTFTSRGRWRIAKGKWQRNTWTGFKANVWRGILRCCRWRRWEKRPLLRPAILFRPTLRTPQVRTQCSRLSTTVRSSFLPSPSPPTRLSSSQQVPNYPLIILFTIFLFSFLWFIYRQFFTY